MKRVFLRHHIVIGILFIYILDSCKSTIIDQDYLNEYKGFKRSFEPHLVSHFPDTISSNLSIFSSRTNKRKNDYGFYLYEYELNLGLVRKVEKFAKNNALAVYSSNKDTLLVVNRFETVGSIENRSIPDIWDSTLIDSSLYSGLYPIPNFQSYKAKKSHKGLWLPSGYSIYVLEAGNKLDSINGLMPNFQMPRGWENGFSRGIAISKKNKTVIYWGILW